MENEKMGLDPKSRVFEFIRTIDLTIDDLRKLQTMLRSVAFEKKYDAERDSDWYSLLKRMIEKKSNLITEQTEPVEDEYLPN